MRIFALLLIFSFLMISSPSNSCEIEVWRGGLWNLDLAFDISTYGYFQFCLEKGDAVLGEYVLKILWMEKRDNLPDRIYASRLFEKIEIDFNVDPSLKIEMGDVPSEYYLSNKQGQKLLIKLWEPARFEISKENINSSNMLLVGKRGKTALPTAAALGFLL